jgi:hypothetical protein
VTPAALSLRASAGPNLAQRYADFHSERADFAHNFQNALKFSGAIVDTAPGCAHAKSGGALSARSFCGINNLLDRQ